MDNVIMKFILAFSGWIWGDPMLYILGLGGVFLMVRLGFIQIRYFKYIWSQTLGKIFDKSTDESAAGTLKPIQALSTALANTVGAGNIVGVGLAIAWGGPGAVFWMWLLGIIGMSTKFAEAVLGQKYRTRNEKGDYVGGAQYFLSGGLRKYHLGWLGAFYACALVGQCFADCMVQCNAIVGSLNEAFGLNIYVAGAVITLTAGVCLFGEVKRIGAIAEKLVPTMAGLYILATIIVVVCNLGKLPGVISLIFTYAFTPIAAVGGFAGATLATTMRWGIARGAYSNQAGDGTAAVAHATAITDHPVRQGFYAVMEVFLDTIVVCSCTAFAILISGVWTAPDVAEKASVLTTVAFSSQWGFFGKVLVAVSLTLFAWTSILAYAWYGEKQAEFLGGYKFSVFMRCVFIGCIFAGTFWNAELLWPFMDLFFAFMILPSMLGVVLMNGEVVALVKEFFNTPGKYYLKDIDSGK
ncbi:MAG: sodium:alanine symporter family protein [Cloacibacillus sp.]